MNGIQILLIGGVVAIFLYYAFRLRNALMDLIALAGFAGLAIFFILFPGYTNTIAGKLGVGRGADLLFYLCILLFIFIIVKLFARIRRLEKMFTEHIRQAAKEDAKFSGDKDDSIAS
jgi:small membrane protein